MQTSFCARLHTGGAVPIDIDCFSRIDSILEYWYSERWTLRKPNRNMFERLVGRTSLCFLESRSSPDTMRAAIFFAVVATATASWSSMDPSSACLDDSLSSAFMTCALPAHTTYNKAFQLAASLPACSAAHTDCYNDDLCR